MDINTLVDKLSDFYEEHMNVKVLSMDLLDNKNIIVMVASGEEQGYFVTPIKEPIIPTEIYSLDGSSTAAEDSQVSSTNQQGAKVGIQRKPGEPIENVGKSAVKKEDINNLLENPFNRELERKKVDNIKEDIKRTKEVYPLVYAEIDHSGEKAKIVTDGHHRLQALKELGYKEVPIVMQDERGIKTKAPKQNVKKSEG